MYLRASLDGSQVRVKLIAGEEGDDDNTVDLEDNTGKYPVFDMHLCNSPPTHTLTHTLKKLNNF
jgi:hypothetical protein